MLKFARAAIVCLLLLTLAQGCGQSTSGAPVKHSLSREQVLGQLDALEAPADAHSAQFAGLKSAMKAALAESVEDRFEVHPPRGPGSVVTDLTLAILPDGSPGIQWTYVNPGDYNFDGQANLADLIHLSAFMGAHTRSDNWAQARHADGDGNGLISIADITPLAANFLGTVTAWQVYSLSSEGEVFAPLLQIPMDERTVGGPTDVPVFLVPISEPWATFKVHALDPSGQSSGPSVDSQPVLRTPRLHVLNKPFGPQLLARNGLELQIELSAISPPENQIKPGDVLLNPASDGFILRVLQAVSAESVLAVQCAQGDITDLFASGVVDLRIAGATLGQPISAQFENMVLRNDSELKVEARSGKVTFVPQGDMLIGLDTAGDLVHCSGALYSSTLDVELDLAANGFSDAQPFPETDTERANYEKLVKGSRATGQVELASGIEIPIEVTADVLLGLEGEGEILGEQRLSLAGSFEIDQSGGSFNGADRTWRQRHVYSGSFSNVEAPVISKTSGNFKLRPYFKVRTTLRVFPEAQEVRPAAWVIEQIACSELAAESTETPSPGFNIKQSSSLGTRFQASLAPVGIFNQDTELVSSGDKQVFHSGFVDGTLSLPDTYTISGSITDAYEMAPLAGIAVRLLTQGSLSEIGVVETDSSGHYSFGSIEARTAVRVVAEHEWYVFTPSWAEFVVNGDLGQDFTAYFSSGM